ncbi:hypothetical protein CRUP_011872 [Coryphaenoides rupestris]|nr:hypothetical protein CRUP_011872 [Coryphaenoides rupestris]
MIQRYCKGVFTKDYKKTIGVDFLERQIIVNDEEVRLMLWDTAGQEEFDAITRPTTGAVTAILWACPCDQLRAFLPFVSAPTAGTQPNEY